MIHNRIYYDYFDGEKAPIWFVIDVQKSEVDWSQDILLVPIQTPFECLESEEFNHSAINTSITMNELTTHVLAKHFGINLNLLKVRLFQYEVEPEEIDHLVIQVADVEEIMQFIIH